MFGVRKVKQCPVIDVVHSSNPDKQPLIFDGSKESRPRVGYMVGCPSCLLFTEWHDLEADAVAEWDEMAKVEKKAEEFRDR